MKTSSFSVYKGSGRISIARSTPRRMPAGFRIFKDLAPGPWFSQVNDAEYRKLFASEVLKRLDPKQVWKELHDLVPGVEPILLCWETLEEPDEWCHRRLVADWFKKELGESVVELKLKLK